MAAPAPAPHGRVVLLDCFLRRVSVLPRDAFEPARMAEVASLSKKKRNPSRACSERAADLLGAAEIARVLREPAAAEVVMTWVALGGRDRVLMCCLKSTHMPAGVVFTGGGEAACVFGRALLVGVPEQATDQLTLAYAFDHVSCARPSDGVPVRFDPSLLRCGEASCAGKGTKSCSRCKSVRYCGGACQKADWPAHREACRAAFALATPERHSIELPSALGSEPLQPQSSTSVPVIHVSSQETFGFITRSLCNRDNRKLPVIGIEFNYAMRRTVELFQADIDANSEALTNAGFRSAARRT